MRWNVRSGQFLGIRLTESVNTICAIYDSCVAEIPQDIVVVCVPGIDFDVGK